MRYFLTLSKISIIFFISLIGTTHIVHATECTYDQFIPNATGQCNPGNVCSPEGMCVSANTGETNGNTGTTATTNTTSSQNNLNPPSTPTWYENNKIFGTIMMTIMSTFAWMLGVAMIVLDAVVLHTVVRMGDYVHNLVAIGATWEILRDLSNIVLIFGFLAIGISTILNTELLGYGKKTLPMLIIVAVFLNFSLFITEAIVDTGNLFAVQFYQQINGGHSAGDGNASSHPISDAIMKQLGLQTIYDDARANNQEALKGNNPFLVGILGSALFMVASLVMFSIAIMLVFRFVALIFVIIIAPLGFVGYAVPQLKSVAKQWWDLLIQQTITAPVLLLMLYIALRVILDNRFLNFGGGIKWLGFLGVGESSDFAGFASGMIAFLVAIGLLLAVILTAKKLSAFGSEWAIKTAGKFAFGAPAWVGRATLGWGSRLASNAIRTSRIGGTKTGRVLAGITDYGSQASFDVRGTGALKSIPYGGIDAGTAQKGGYQARYEKTAKGHEAYAKSIAKAFEVREVNEANKIEKNLKLQMAEHEKISKEGVVLQSEVNRLKEQNKNDKYWQTDPKNVQALETAEKNLRDNNSAVADSEKNLKKTMEDRKNKSSDDIKNEKIKALEAYAENMKGLASWAVFGPGGKTVAKTVIKNATKKENKIDLDKLKKYMEES